MKRKRRMYISKRKTERWTERHSDRERERETEIKVKSERERRREGERGR